MQTVNKTFPEILARQIWLHYFNDYLRERNIITEDEWRKLRQKIGEYTAKGAQNVTSERLLFLLFSLDMI